MVEGSAQSPTCEPAPDTWAETKITVGKEPMRGVSPNKEVKVTRRVQDKAVSGPKCQVGRGGGFCWCERGAWEPLEVLEPS